MAKLKLPTISSLPKEFKDENEEVLVHPEGHRQAGEPMTWIDVLLDIYRNGGGDEEAIRALRITRAVFGTLMTDDELFLGVVDHGRLCRHAWFLEQGRKNLHNKGFNTVLWYKQMINILGWSDKQEQAIGELDLKNQSKEQIDALFAEREAAFYKMMQKKLA